MYNVITDPWGSYMSFEHGFWNVLDSAAYTIAYEGESAYLDPQTYFYNRTLSAAEFFADPYEQGRIFAMYTEVASLEFAPAAAESLYGRTAKWLDTPAVVPEKYFGLSGQFVSETNALEVSVPRTPVAGAAPRVNPGFPGAGRTKNCVNCSLATDATFAGHPASALPTRGPRPISVIEQAYGGKFIRALGRSDIEHVMSSLGPGSRGIVFGEHAGRPGHVFNAVVNQRGVVKFFDGQTGKPASLEGFTGFRLLITSPE